MNNWKKQIEQEVSAAYKGVKIKWNGDNPTLVIPDHLKPKAREIAEYTTGIWEIHGGRVEFHLDKAREER